LKFSKSDSTVQILFAKICGVCVICELLTQPFQTKQKYRQILLLCDLSLFPHYFYVCYVIEIVH